MRRNRFTGGNVHRICFARTEVWRPLSIYTKPGLARCASPLYQDSQSVAHAPPPPQGTKTGKATVPDSVRFPSPHPATPWGRMMRRNRHFTTRPGCGWMLTRALPTHVKKVWRRSQSSLIHKSTSAPSEEEIERFNFYPSLWPFRSVSSFCSIDIVLIHFCCDHVFAML